MPIRFLALLVFGVLSAGCGAGLKPPPQPLVHGDLRPIPKVPKTRAPSLANEIIEMTFGYQLKQALDLPRQARKLVGRPYEALNVDAFDAGLRHRNGQRRSFARTLSEVDSAAATKLTANTGFVFQSVRPLWVELVSVGTQLLNRVMCCLGQRRWKDANPNPRCRRARRLPVDHAHAQTPLTQFPC